MSAASYKLTLSGENRLSPAIKSASADLAELTAAAREQEKAVKSLNNSQTKLSRYSDLRKGFKATRTEMAKTESELKGLAVKSDQAAQTIKVLTAQKQTATQETRKLEKAIARAGVPTKKLAAQYKESTKKLANLNDELSDQKTHLKDLKKRSTDATKYAAKLANTFDKEREKAWELRKELRESKINTGALAREQQRLQRETSVATQSLEHQTDRLKRLGKARGNLAKADSRLSDVHSRVIGTAAIAASVIAPVKRAVTLESAVAGVDKVADFKGDEKEKFQSDLQKLAVEVNIPPEQLALIAESAAQSGNVKKEGLIDFTRSTSKMAVAFDMTAEAAGEAMVAWRDSMSLNQNQALKLMDAVNFIGNNTGGKSSEISGVLKRQGALAVGSGLSPEQAAGLAGAILSSKQGEEVSATALKNLLDALTSGDAVSKSKREGLAKIGLSPDQLPSAMQSDAAGTMLDLFERLRAVDKDKRVGLMKEIAGEDSVGAIMPLLNNPELLKKAFGLVANPANYKGSAEQEYQKIAETSEHQIGRAWRAIDRLGIVLGDSLLPATNLAAGAIEWAADGVADLAEQGGYLTTAVTLGAAAYATYKTAQLGYQLAQAAADKARATAVKNKIEKEINLAKKTGATATKANLATRAIDRLNRSLATTAASGAAEGGKKGKRKRKGLGNRKKGPAVIPATHSDKAVKAKVSMNKSLTKNLTRSAPLLNLAMSAPLMIDAVKSGDAKQIAETSGAVAGGAAGAWGGAAAGGSGGAALGTAVFPGVGTVVGGTIGSVGGAIVGGMAGTEVGQWIGKEALEIGKGIGNTWQSWFGDDETGSAFKALRAKQEKEQHRINKLMQSNKIDLKSVINIQLTAEENARNIKQIVDQKLDEAVNQNLIPAINNTLNQSVEDSTSLAP